MNLNRLAFGIMYFYPENNKVQEVSIIPSITTDTLSELYLEYTKQNNEQHRDLCFLSKGKYPKLRKICKMLYEIDIRSSKRINQDRWKQMMARKYGKSVVSD